MNVRKTNRHLLSAQITNKKSQKNHNCQLYTQFPVPSERCQYRLIIPKLGFLSGLEPDLSLSSFKPCIRIQQDVESCFIEVWEWLSNRKLRLPSIIKLETQDRDHLATPMLVLDELLCWCCMARFTIGRVKEAQGGERQPRGQQLLMLETGQVDITSVLELKE